MSAAGSSVAGIAKSCRGRAGDQVRTGVGLVRLANRTVTGAPKGPSVTKSAFFSFHYDRDHWRVQQVLNMGSLEGQTTLNHQKWEEVKRQGDAAIKRWIDEQMNGKSVVVVLVGAQTADREWVRYEIAHAWDNHKPLVGIRIHGLQNEQGRTDQASPNPFSLVQLQKHRRALLLYRLNLHQDHLAYSVDHSFRRQLLGFKSSKKAQRSMHASAL